MTTVSAIPERELFVHIELPPLSEALISVFECTGIAKNSATYVSTPITSGEALLRRLLDGRGDNGSDPGPPELDALIRENIRHAQTFITTVRMRFTHYPVVDPTRLMDIPGFTQPDYHQLWCAFVERFSRTVVFNAGWALSTGCVAEFTTAALSNKQLLDSKFSPISLQDGLDEIEQAMRRLRAASRPVQVHIDAIAALQVLAVEG